MGMLSSPLVPFWRPLTSSSLLTFNHTLTPTSSPPGTTSIKTTRDGSDTRRPTLSRDTLMVTSTNSPTLQDLLVTCHPEVKSTHSHTQLDLRLFQSAPSEESAMLDSRQ